jgi:hypothetical protein
MNNNSYTDRLAALAAHNLRAAAEERRLRDRLASMSRGALRRVRGVARSLLPPTFAELGNYPGKRAPKPTVAPLAPRERFLRLAAAYLARAMATGRVAGAADRPSQRHAEGRTYFIEFQPVRARTRSEARGVFKRLTGARTTRGLEAAAA